MNIIQTINKKFGVQQKVIPDKDLETYLIKAGVPSLAKLLKYVHTRNKIRRYI